MSTCAHARSYNIIHAQYFYYTTVYHKTITKDESKTLSQGYTHFDAWHRAYACNRLSVSTSMHKHL